MKKYLSVILISVYTLIMLSSCDNDLKAKVLEGVTINMAMPKGYKVEQIAWKNDELWCLTVPIDSDYKPRTVMLIKKSDLGMTEKVIKFIETK